MPKRLPNKFPHRLVYVKGWSAVFHVPRHIVRIDIDDPGKAGTHGWQVRYQKPSVMFSDAKNNDRRSPRASLADATRYLAAIYAGPRVLIRTTPTKRKKNLIQEAGIRLVERVNKKKNITEMYLEAVSPTNKKASKRFYVGTLSTVTNERINDATIKARACRQQMVSDYLSIRGVI